MWHYSLLGMPLFGLVLFFVVAFDLALLLYLALVLSAFVIYYKITERRSTSL